MTLNRFIKHLQSLADAGHGRCDVSIDKPTFTHNLEGDGAVVLQVSHVRHVCVPQMDDDGGTKCDSKGRECLRGTIVLYGASWEPTP